MLTPKLNSRQNSDHVGSEGTFRIPVNPWVINFTITETSTRWTQPQPEKNKKIGGRAPPKFVEKFPLSSGDLVFLHDMRLVWF